MHGEMDTIRCTIMRGGTSKGIFLLENELAAFGESRDAVIRSIFGSPDMRQIDGLGGADVLTSKLAIVGPSTKEGAHVDYTFGQVSFADSVIDYKGNCGNISSAVGPFAIDMGLVKAVEPITEIKIHMTNSGRILTAQVPVKNGKAAVEGDFSIDGVPGTGAPITMDWSGSVGAITGKLLPTGNVKDVITVDSKQYEISIVDAGNPLVFIKAEALKLKGSESSQEIEDNTQLMELIEKIRGESAKLCGLLDKAEESVKKSPYNPFFAIVSPSQESDIHVVARLLFMQRMHKTYPITGTVCTGAASKVAGSVLWEVLTEEGRKTERLHIGHPAGMVPVEIKGGMSGDGECKIEKIGVYRTARMIMDGHVYIRKDSWR